MQQDEWSEKLTVIIPNYNYGQYLEECFGSVLSQTVQPDELIIIDDCSTDNSESVLQKIESQYQVTVIRNEKNLGIVGNFNKAVEISTGDLIIFIGADNRVKPDFLERYREAAKKQPHAAVYYSDTIIFGKRSHLLAFQAGATHLHDDLYEWKFPDPTPEAIADMDHTNFIHGSSMFRRIWFDKVSGYQETENPEDFDFFRRIIKAGGQPFHVQFSTLEYRQHSHTQANTLLQIESQLKNLQNLVQVQNEHIFELTNDLESKSHRIESLENSTTRLKFIEQHADRLIKNFGYASFQGYVHETESRSIKSRINVRFLQISGIPLKIYRSIFGFNRK